jgi:hypothetical protein
MREILRLLRLALGPHDDRQASSILGRRLPRIKISNVGAVERNVDITVHTLFFVAFLGEHEYLYEILPHWFADRYMLLGCSPAFSKSAG